MPQTELQMMATYLTGRLNQLIAIVNTKTTTAQALTAIRNGVPVAGDDLLKLYNLAVGLQTNINTINALLTSNDTTLDELQEVVDFIKMNRADLDALSIPNIAGLQDALDAKLPLAGGDMYGDIQFGGSLAKFGTGVEIYGENQAIVLSAVNAVIALLASGKNWQFRDTDLLTTAFGYQAMLKWVALSANRTATFPDKNITVAGLDDIDAAIAALVDTSPSTLDTLNELAAALGDDPNFATTITGLIAAKASLSGFTMAGNITMGGYQLIAQYLKTVSDELQLVNSGNFAAVLNIAALTANRNIVIQNKDHTIAGLDDIKDITIVSSTTPSSHTGDINETVKFTESIPAGTYITHDKIIQEILASAIGSSGIKTIRTYINTTANLAGTPILISTYSTNNLGYSLISSFFVDSKSSMKSYKPGNSNLATYWGSSNASLGRFAINWTIQQYLVVTVQLAYSTDIIQLEGIFLNRSRK